MRNGFPLWSEKTHFVDAVNASNEGVTQQINQYLSIGYEIQK